MRKRERERQEEGRRNGMKSIEHSHYLFSIVTRGATSQATNSPLQLYRHPTAPSLANVFVLSSVLRLLFLLLHSRLCICLDNLSDL